MTLLQWKPSYALGIPSVDHEHRQLIALINETYEHLEGSADPDAVERCLEDICAGIAAHFALEERHMREAGYAEYAATGRARRPARSVRDLMDTIREPGFRPDCAAAAPGRLVREPFRHLRRAPARGI
jgi:hemerythrin